MRKNMDFHVTFHLVNDVQYRALFEKIKRGDKFFKMTFATVLFAIYCTVGK